MRSFFGEAKKRRNLASGNKNPAEAIARKGVFFRIKLIFVDVKSVVRDLG
jgi:hypothetical protein